MNTTPTLWPFLSIQSDWNKVLKKPNGKVWVSCKVPGYASQNGYLSVSPDPGQWKLTASEHFAADAQHSLHHLTLKSSNATCQFVPATSEFHRIHKQPVVSLDVAPGGLGVSTSAHSNYLTVWETTTGEVRRELKGHVWDVYTCRFFPSGLVILSGGADMQLRIWSAENGQCPVTLVGHKAAVVETAIVEKGRNVVSVSKDGTAKLWDCGKAACLGTLTATTTQDNDPLNCCALATVLPGSQDLGEPLHPPNEREVKTEGKLLLLGSEKGKVLGYGLQSRLKVFSLELERPVNCCAFMDDPAKFLCGLQDGSIWQFDIRNLSSPAAVWQDSASGVLALRVHGPNRVMASRQDGTVALYAPGKGALLQLTGSDCDPIYSIATDNCHWFTACRDGIVRKYRLPDIINPYCK